MPVPREVVSDALAKWYRGQEAAESDDEHSMIDWWHIEGQKPCSFCEHFSLCKNCPLSINESPCHPAWNLLKDMHHETSSQFRKDLFKKAVSDMILAIEDVEVEEDRT